MGDGERIFSRLPAGKFLEMPILAGSKLKIFAAERSRRAGYAGVFCRAFSMIAIFGCMVAFAVIGEAQERFENLAIGNVSVVVRTSDGKSIEDDQLGAIAMATLGDRYSTVRIRDSIEQLYFTGRVITAEAEASETADNSVDLRFIVKLKTRARRVSVSVVTSGFPSITEQEILLRVNLLDPGASVSEQSLQANANFILEYLRDKGYFRAEVTHTIRALENENDVEVGFRVTPGEQARVESFDISIKGFEAGPNRNSLRLKKGAPFSRALLARDIERIRRDMQNKNFRAPELNEPRVVFENETNTVEIQLTGTAGPVVDVLVDADGKGIASKTANRLLPIARGGSLDFAAIVEGERRLENYYQEKGYFFADATALCSVDPPLPDSPPSAADGDAVICSVLNNSELAGRTVSVLYKVDLNRRLKLTDIRLRGTDQFDVTEIVTVLDSSEANILGIIPFFGYGRGFTSSRILEEDAETIRGLLHDLGYRESEVRVNQGVSPDGKNLIITFVVDEGTPTMVSEVQITGNSVFPTATLEAELPPLLGKNFSRARIRNGQRKLAEFYSGQGYFDAIVDFSVDELPTDPDTGQKSFRVVYNIAREGERVFVNRILVNGNNSTRTDAILKAINIHSGEKLTFSDIYKGEQNLYATDVFAQVDIKTQPAGVNPGGGRKSDLIVDVEEQKPRLLQYGGGYSNDLGLSGFVDIRHFNLFGRLWQGGTRLRWTQERQLVQFDFVNPRFFRDGKGRYAPLTLTAQYQRDSTVTRFFRSAFDQGTFGIVQRLDENGNPIDEFGGTAGNPTLNRFTLSAETNRTISLKNRTLVFFRYKFEDVRLFNIDSLLIRELLEPDRRVRVSAFGTTFVRDTRRNCSAKYSILDIASRGEAGDRCRYDAIDPTNGTYFTADYNVSIPALGANIGFSKFQASYNYFQTIPGISNFVIAARAIFGIGSVFSKTDRFSKVEIPELDGILPISERFFAGGANSLRGFGLESAGPRIVVVPDGTFRNKNGDPVFLDPFSVPFGGNAMALVNIEGRKRIAGALSLVPFYDGGNVYRKAGDIFKGSSIPSDDVVRRNLRAVWSHTIGLGFRIRTPVGGELGLDYGYLLNPPKFLIPQPNGQNAFQRLHQGQIQIRFSQSF